MWLQDSRRQLSGAAVYVCTNHPVAPRLQKPIIHRMQFWVTEFNKYARNQKLFD